MKLRGVIFALLLCLLIAGVGEAASDIVRLGVMRFTSKADGVSDRQAEIITDIFTRTMSNSRSIALIERERLDMIGREHSLNMSGLVDMGMAVEVGRLAGVQYMLMGSVTGLNEAVSGGGFGGFVQGNRVAEATIDVRIVDVTTSEIILSLVQKGTSARQSQAVSFQGLTWAEADLSDIKALAVTDAATRLGHRIREELAGEFSQVISTSGRSVNINVGSTSGAQKGDLYLIYSDGREILDIDGTSLGREKHSIAVVRVQTVSGGFSTAEVVPSGGKADLVQRGDKIEPISSRESQELAKQKRFVAERPRRRAYDETADMLFGGASGGAEPVPAMSLQPSDEFSSDEISANVPPAPAPVPTPARAAAPAGQSFENESTDPAKVVATYALSTGDKNIRRVAHLNAQKLSNSRRAQEVQQGYDAYVELTNSYGGDYLAAYQAGEVARKQKKQDDALAWYDKALAINPNYKPALDAAARLR